MGDASPGPPMATFRCPAAYYQQFPTRPGHDDRGWRETELTFSADHTALVVMHAWHLGAPGEFPGWENAVDYGHRARQILAHVFPPLLDATRRARLPIFHVIDPGTTCPSAPDDPIADDLRRFRRAHVYPGLGNVADIERGFAELSPAPEATPRDHEPVAIHADHLADLCRARGVNHLIYVGFALNWCLLMSPAGMIDMGRRGFLCSTIREAVTAVENADTAAAEREKQQALWRVAVAFGFVFSLASFLAALPHPPTPPSLLD